MRLLRLKADRFGPLRGEWKFSIDKLNLVVDENERGKSSLLAAIVAGLYGLEDDRRSHRVLTPLERWRPWDGGTFRVEIDVKVGGDVLTVHRDFDRGAMTVFDQNGKDRSAEFLASADVTLGRQLLGLDASEFEKSALLRQGELDQVVPGDEKARRSSTLRARLENAADTQVGDTNASEAMRVLDEAVRRYTVPELEFTGTLDNAIDRLQAKRGLVAADLSTLEHDLGAAAEPLERLAAHGDEEAALKGRLRELEHERHAGLAADLRRQLAQADARRDELARLEAEAALLAGASNLSHNAEADLRETLARHEEAVRNLETLESRHREEIDRERSALEAELAPVRDAGQLAPEAADQCVAIAADLRRIALDEAHLRNEVFTLRDQLAALGYEPERIQFLTSRFGPMPEEQQKLLRQQSELALAFQTEVAGLEHERTDATETLRSVDATRNGRRVPGWFLLALGLGGVLAAAVVYALKGASTVWLPLGAASALAALAGGALLSIGGRAQSAERDVALRKLSEAQRRLNTLHERRNENEVGLNELSRMMAYRDAVDLMRHWNEYVRLLEDSAPLARAQDQLQHIEQRRSDAHEQARVAAGALLGANIGPDPLERAAYEIRRALNAKQRLAELERRWEWVAEEKRLGEAAVSGLKERAVRILQAAGLAYDPERSWADHVTELASRVRGRSRHTVLVEELIPYAKAQLASDEDVRVLRERLAQLGGEDETAERSTRPTWEIEADSRQVREKLEEVQRQRGDLRVEVEDVLRRHGTRRPELEAEIARFDRAVARARRFKTAIEIARTTLQEVAVDTHRKWADWLNPRVSAILESFGTRVDQLRFGDDLDFSVQMDGGPLVSRGKAHLQLSSGARDQLYLAVRLAVSEYLSRGRAPLPLLIDDAFASSDDGRLRSGMQALLASLGAGHQVVAVTCHRGRHEDLRRSDPSTWRDRVNWIEVQSSSTSRG